MSRFDDEYDKNMKIWKAHEASDKKWSVEWHDKDKKQFVAKHDGLPIFIYVLAPQGDIREVKFFGPNYMKAAKKDPMFRSNNINYYFARAFDLRREEDPTFNNK